jgi:hypothetical protein
MPLIFCSLIFNRWYYMLSICGEFFRVTESVPLFQCDTRKSVTNEHEKNWILESWNSWIYGQFGFRIHEQFPASAITVGEEEFTNKVKEKSEEYRVHFRLSIFMRHFFKIPRYSCVTNFLKKKVCIHLFFLIKSGTIFELFCNSGGDFVRSAVKKLKTVEPRLLQSSKHGYS